MDNLARFDLQKLASLLNIKDDEDLEDDSYELDSENSKPHFLAHSMNASHMINDDYEENNKCDDTLNKNIWSDDEVPDEEQDEYETKKKPEYKMVYQQSVTTDDVFLQLSGKGPGSENCECLLVKIKLPEVCSKDEMNLNISVSKLICKTKEHYLDLDLPKPIDPVESSAKWDQEQRVLIVKLMVDVDYIFRT